MHRFLKIISLSLLLVSCGSPETKVSKKIELRGNTQGTTYQIILADADLNFKPEAIDSVLAAFDTILSTYIDSSLISKINASETNFSGFDKAHFFQRVYEESMEVYQLSEGAFDPSVFPLVAGWGFMKNVKSPLKQAEVDSILQFVSLEKSKLHELSFVQKGTKSQVYFTKKDPRFKLDFNAIAQGLSVDVLVEFLESKGYKNYFVEIGGEIRVSGKNPDGENWRIGIDLPVENQAERQLENILATDHGAIATSGNYRHFYELDGKKYAHTLDPRTGFPVQHSLLSATVFAPKCSTADAYATVFMVIGLEKAKAFMEKHPELNLEAYFLYSDEKGAIKRYETRGIEAMMQN